MALRVMTVLGGDEGLRIEWLSVKNWYVLDVKEIGVGQVVKGVLLDQAGGDQTLTHFNL